MGDFGSEVVGQEDVGGVEVAVDDGRDGVLVEGLEGARTIEGYPQPGPPIQRLLIAPTVEVALETAARHQLEDQKPVVLVGAVTHKLN